MAIKSFRSKKLERFYTKGTLKGINAQHADKLGRVLDRLNASTEPNDMRLPGYRLHKLEPKTAERWAVDISGNFRVTFEFDGEDAIVVDYEDYH
ncbi:type II toxin-antitoxin system RelE/ParE family toxin [Kangiella koreensis]|uniref:Plasmid maintenance system killer n=1 Tax=Kangiella koreensis (strain DSM 16069 / JCM 12317 / KCTC 12182 / SW-125) TaxID=523791 RepID=C7R829_KANKD|nr:type II toxin-antitoxin system RelE/ParE family toxin [Kangiella koreensis]ACV25811.1 plasmid maintenance system killer [Kangiella koreensis DSM 16069]